MKPFPLIFAALVAENNRIAIEAGATPLPEREAPDCFHCGGRGWIVLCGESLPCSCNPESKAPTSCGCCGDEIARGEEECAVCRPGTEERMARTV